VNKSKKDNDNIDRNNSKSENNKNKKDLLMKKFHQNIHLKTIRFKKSKDHYNNSL
jgi:hypothetical protein